MNAADQPIASLRRLLLFFFATLVTPTLLLRNLHIDNQASFDQALDFLYDMLKLSIFLSLLVASYAPTLLSEIVWLMNRILGFVFCGFATWLFLRLLCEQRVFLDKVYNVFSYPAGVLMLVRRP